MCDCLLAQNVLLTKNLAVALQGGTGSNASSEHKSSSSIEQRDTDRTTYLRIKICRWENNSISHTNDW